MDTGQKSYGRLADNSDDGDENPPVLVGCCGRDRLNSVGVSRKKVSSDACHIVRCKTYRRHCSALNANVGQGWVLTRQRQLPQSLLGI